MVVKVLSLEKVFLEKGVLLTNKFSFVLTSHLIF